MDDFQLSFQLRKFRVPFFKSLPVLVMLICYKILQIPRSYRVN